MTLTVLLLCIIWGIVGELMEAKKVIMKPSYWALYGAVFGLILASISK